MPETSKDRIEFLRRLRSTKAFTPEPVADDVINDILEVGRWSGTSANKQPTEVIVVRDGAAREKIGGWGAKPAATAPVSFLIVTRNEGGAGMDEGRLGERLMLAAHAH